MLFSARAQKLHSAPCSCSTCLPNFHLLFLTSTGKTGSVSHSPASFISPSWQLRNHTFYSPSVQAFHPQDQRDQPFHYLSQHFAVHLPYCTASIWPKHQAVRIFLCIAYQCRWQQSQALWQDSVLLAAGTLQPCLHERGQCTSNSASSDQRQNLETNLLKTR